MTVENCAAPGGVPTYLIVDQWGRFSLAYQRGTEFVGKTGFCDRKKVAELAYKVAGGDPHATTHPKTLMQLALTVLANEAELAFASKGERVTDGIEEVERVQ
jgi:hypothetical protein